MKRRAKKQETFDQWKAMCNEAAATYLPELGDLWQSDDPYDLEEVAADAFAAKMPPEQFVRETFADEIASKTYDEDLAQQLYQEYEDEDCDE